MRWTVVRTLTRVITSQPLLVLLTLIAVARATRIVTDDAITEPLRRWVINHRPAPAEDGEDPIVYLIHCRWCASIWLAFPAASAVYFWGGTAAVQIVVLALAASHISGLIAHAER